MQTIVSDHDTRKPSPVLISNADFLRGIFGAPWEQAHCTVFAGDPAVDPRWKGWRAGARLRRLEAADANTYFTISLFDPLPDGGASRTARLFRATYVVVVDDVGTKVDAAQTLAKLGEPSYRLETSPGNDQWGYKLDLPEHDEARVNALINGMIAKGLSTDGRDPGMKGVTRYVRMPNGTNWKAKYGPGGFRCVLHTWHPERTFTPDELAAAFGITLPKPGEVPSRSRDLSVGQAGPADTETGATHDRPDICLEVMRELGHVREWVERPGFKGWSCECPCIDEHTDGVDNGCAYAPENGAWVCFHGHCQASGPEGKPRPWPEYYAGLDRKLVALGMAPMRAREFPDAADDPASGQDDAPGVRGVSARTRFMADHVFLKPDNAFWNMTSKTLVPRASANLVHASALAGETEYLDEKDKVRHMPVDRWYVGQADARVADQKVYWPGKPGYFEDGGVRYVNLYVPPRYMDPGYRVRNRDVAPWLGLVSHVLTGEAPRALVFLLDWMALVASQPSVKPGAVVLVHGAQGIGKDMLLGPVLWAVGQDNGVAIPGDALSTGFTGWASKRLVQIKELRQTTRGGMSAHDAYARLKWLGDTSAEWLSINPKMERPFQARNVAAVYISSNEEDAASLAGDDRRMFVVGSTAKRLDPDYYVRVRDWLSGDGNRLVQAWLRQRWDRMSAGRRGALMGNAPVTRGRGAMIEAVADPVAAWLADRLADDASTDWPDVMTAEQVVGAIGRAVTNGQEGLPRGWRVPGVRAVGKMLTGLGAVRLNGGVQVRVRGKRERLWAVRRGDVLGALPLRELVELRDKGAGADFVETADVLDFPGVGSSKDETPGGSETS